MLAIDSFFIVAGLASIAGLIYSLYLSRAPEKSLAYDVSPPVAIATAVSPAGKNKLAILLRHENGFEKRIESAYIRFLRVANFGRSPIRGTDLSETNRLRVVCQGMKLLDLSIAVATRSANNIQVSDIRAEENNFHTALSFEFLDRRDGAVIAILTEGSEGTACLEGDVIGMPQGVARRNASVVPPLFRFVGWSIAVLIQAASMLAPYFIYKSVTGSWHGAWVLALPLLAILIPVTVFLLGTHTFTKRWKTFPSDLSLPTWYQALKAVAQVLDFEGADPEGIRQTMSPKPARLDEKDNGKHPTKEADTT